MSVPSAMQATVIATERNSHAAVNTLAFANLRFVSPPQRPNFIEVASTLGLAFGLLALVAAMELRWRRQESARVPESLALADLSSTTRMGSV